ncbi:MAG: ABC transporter substrate-binding protein [Desulfatitalea sp.]
MQRCLRFGFLPSLVLILICLCAPVMAAETIKIGIIGPMQFVQGKSAWNGAEMAAEEVNAQGGIKVGNKKMLIELVKADSNEFISIPAAANAMEALILRDKANFVIGGFRTEAVLAMQDIAMDNKVIFIGTGAAHPELCLRVAQDYERYKYWFRGSPFNSDYLIKTLFAQLRSVATLMKKKLEIDRIRVAIIAEKAMWVDPMVKEAETFLPKMGMEVVGVWRPSPGAREVNAELAAIQRENAHIIFTVVSGPVGIPLAKQAGELKIPAVMIGINVEAAKDGFWEATQGMANYVTALNTYVRSAEYNEQTGPFVDAYYKRYGEVPLYTAASYAVIKTALKIAIEEAGTLNPEKIIPLYEKGIITTPAGIAAYEKDEQGRQLHDLKWGPGYSTSMGIQWQDGKMFCVWPHFKWMSPYWEFSAEPPETPGEFDYKGLKPYLLPPWVMAAYKKK